MDLSPPLTRVGAYLRAARQDRNWSQRTLARRVGVTSAAVSYWERGPGSPRYAMLFVVAGVLSVEPRILIRMRYLDGIDMARTRHPDHTCLLSLINYGFPGVTAGDTCLSFYQRTLAELDARS